ncbi:PREDICTED: E3 ubiquitin-protein ligase RNF31-like, partial [Pseudopodoces humilis]|uniref:E3 ubiquitin-protein ligase RNF31-like n=1 Tax=Pseudopodoces humilis TaxID=181119 RepID=UPI0006B818B9
MGARIEIAHAHYGGKRADPILRRAAILDPPPLPEVMPDPPKAPPDSGSLQELRKALEGSLRLRPALAEPPELLPLLRLPLPPQGKLAVVPGTQILRENLAWDPRGPPRGLPRLRRALHVLEKYGRNLLGPRPPPHWRDLRFGNPVYRSALAHIQ